METEKPEYEFLSFCLFEGNRLKNPTITANATEDPEDEASAYIERLKKAEITGKVKVVVY